MPSEIVDGQDVDAVEATIGGAVDQGARRRWADSGRGEDLPVRRSFAIGQGTYRPAGELDTWLERDPITLFGEKLVAEGVVDEAGLEKIRAQAVAVLDATFERVLASPYPTEAQMLGRQRPISSGQSQRR